MKKTECLKVFPASTPEGLSAEYNAWHSERVAAREQNAVLAGMPFAVNERSLMPVGQKYALAVFYTDYVLETPEKGNKPRAGVDMSEGASAVGADIGSKKRR